MLQKIIRFLHRLQERIAQFYEESAADVHFLTGFWAYVLFMELIPAKLSPTTYAGISFGLFWFLAYILFAYKKSSYWSPSPVNEHKWGMSLFLFINLLLAAAAAWYWGKLILKPKWFLLYCGAGANVLYAIFYLFNRANYKQSEYENACECGEAELDPVEETKSKLNAKVNPAFPVYKVMLLIAFCCALLSGIGYSVSYDNAFDFAVPKQDKSHPVYISRYDRSGWITQEEMRKIENWQQSSALLFVFVFIYGVTLKVFMRKKIF